MPANPDHLLVLRRQILKFLKEAYPAPVDTAELTEALPLANVADAATEVREALQALQAWDFITNVRHDAARPPWWRITAAGLGQITREAERLDVRVWGKLAIG